MKKSGFVNKLKTKWGISSNVDFVLIMLVFSFAGLAVSFSRRPICHLLGVDQKVAWWIKILVNVPLFVLLYQLWLMIFSSLLGQFAFFWEREKKIGRFLSRVFSRFRTG